MNDLIKSFDEFIAKLCKNVTLNQASKYAARGEEYLKSFMYGSDCDNDDIMAVGFCILWCLLKKSYDNQMPFGKGMFLIEFEDDPDFAKVTNLFKRLSGKKPAYTRISSHFNERSKKQYGIDSYKRKRHEYITPPYEFSTICFGFCEEADGSKTLFIKPERYGFDIFGNPRAAFWHTLDFIKHIKFSPQKVEGTKSFRETGTSRENVLEDFVQKGNEIRFVVNHSDIGFRVPFKFFAIAEQHIDALLNNMGTIDHDLQLFVIRFLDYLRSYNSNVAYETRAFKRLSRKHISDRKNLDHTIILRHKELFEIIDTVKKIDDIEQLYQEAKNFITTKMISPNYNSKPLLFFANSGTASYRLRVLEEKLKLSELQSTVDLPTLSKRAVLLS